MRVKMCSIHVDDPLTAFDFYTEKLGFEELIAMPEYQLYVVKSPEDPLLGLLLEPSDNSIAQAYKKGLHKLGVPAIVFGTADVQAEFERLRALGIPFTQEPSTDAAGTTAIFDDGCGNLIQLHQD
jgi:catechol 2,3-dioxygenase-like lactoylglutathione lyase family enzyme